MSLLHRRLLPPRALAWVLWLALVLPLAQLAAAAHGVAHAQADGSGGAKQAVQLAQCDLCLVAAAIGSAAAPTVAAPPAMPALRHAAPQAWHAAQRAAPAPFAYRSRAPPPAAH